ncbi:hypothetical protein QQZ08_010077 [Neonectria magnoliae]|uniref:Uncharacterized protein n=1 Tax=Neonectria magnoliae TaxID=2732573 RepID=A0ABR1HJH6_9HYPO
MSQTNPAHTLPHHSNTRICDVNVDEYGRGPGETSFRKTLRVCQVCKGVIVARLLELVDELRLTLRTNEIRQALLSLAQETSVIQEVTENDIWVACGLDDFPALARFRSPWLRYVRHLVMEFANNLEKMDSAHPDASFETDPQAVYTWWKQRIQQHKQPTASSQGRQDIDVWLQDSASKAIEDPASPGAASSTFGSLLINPRQTLVDQARQARISSSDDGHDPEPCDLAEVRQGLLSLIQLRERLHEVRSRRIQLEERRNNAEADYALRRGENLKAAMGNATVEDKRALGDVQARRAQL